MATLRQLRYDLYQLIRANGFDDDDLDPRIFDFWVNSQRAAFIRDFLLKKRGGINLLSDAFYQDLGIFNFELREDEFNNPISPAINVSLQKLPKVMYVNDYPLVKLLFLDPRLGNIQLTNINNVNGIGTGLFNSRYVYAFIDHDYIHLISGPNSYYANQIKKIRVKAVLDAPQDAPGFTIDSEYPVDTSFIPYIEKSIRSTYLAPMLSLRNDPVNNAKNDLN